MCLFTCYSTGVTFVLMLSKINLCCFPTESYCDLVHVFKLVHLFKVTCSCDVRNKSHIKLISYAQHVSHTYIQSVWKSPVWPERRGQRSKVTWHFRSFVLYFLYVKDAHHNYKSFCCAWSFGGCAPTWPHSTPLQYLGGATCKTVGGVDVDPTWSFTEVRRCHFGGFMYRLIKRLKTVFRAYCWFICFYYY